MKTETWKILAKVLLFAGVVLLATGGTVFIIDHFFPPTILYSGTETFWAEEDYTVFKEVIANAGAKLEKVETLSSEPPIIVTYTVKVAGDVEFPYGEKVGDYFFFAWLPTLIVGGSLLGIWLAIVEIKLD